MTHDAPFDVIGLGGVCWDILATVPRYPELDEKMEMQEFTQQGGGQAATAIVAVARLGGTAAICGRISDDEFGAKNLAEFRREGVHTDMLQIVPGHTSHFAFCVAELGAGHRTIFWKHGTVAKLTAEDIDREAVLRCKCLLLDAHHSAASIGAARWARDAGVPTVLDMERPHPDSQALLETCDYPILPACYATLLTGLADPVDAGWKLHRDLGRLVIVTLGVRGACAFADGELLQVPAFEVSPVVDTTGAGDVYHGAFAYGLTLGYALEENMRFAAAVAALKCRALGGRTGIPSFAEAREFMDRS